MKRHVVSGPQEGPEHSSAVVPDLNATHLGRRSPLSASSCSESFTDAEQSCGLLVLLNPNSNEEGNPTTEPKQHPDAPTAIFSQRGASCRSQRQQAPSEKARLCLPAAPGYSQPTQGVKPFQTSSHASLMCLPLINLPSCNRRPTNRAAWRCTRIIESKLRTGVAPKQAVQQQPVVGPHLKASVLHG